MPETPRELIDRAYTGAKLTRDSLRALPSDFAYPKELFVRARTLTEDLENFRKKAFDDRVVTQSVEGPADLSAPRH